MTDIKRELFYTIFKGEVVHVEKNHQVRRRRKWFI